MRNLLKTVLAFCTVALLLCGVLAALNGVRTAQDKALLQTAWPVPQGALLPPETETLPLAAALWQRAQFYDPWSMFGSDIGGDATTPDDPALLQRLCTALTDAGVLRAPYAEDAAQSLAQAEPPPVQIAGKLGFSLVSQPQSSLQMELFGNLVTQFYASCTAQGGRVPSGQPYDEIAQSYVAYLGLDTLPDWQPVALDAPQAQKGCALYSESAQLYVYVREELGTTPQGEAYGLLTCGVANAPRQAVEKLLLQSPVE